MRSTHFLLILCACVAALSCKRDAPRPAPDDGRASATQPAPPPVVAPSSQPMDGTLTESQLLQFISVSRKVAPTAHNEGKMPQPSLEGFRIFSGEVGDDEAIKTAISANGMTLQEWISIGVRAWSAWSVAQIDYNAETTIRENAMGLTAAREKLALAEATIKSGAREMSADERARRVAAARDAMTNANDRAELWATKAAALRAQIEATADIGRSNAPGEPPAIAGARADALGSAQAGMSQELAVAERNERQARDDAKRAEEAAEHPEQPLNETERSELLGQSRHVIEQAKSDIERLQQKEKLLTARLGDDRRINADERRKSASEADIATLRKHLAEFNDAWRMTIEGRQISPSKSR